MYDADDGIPVVRAKVELQATDYRVSTDDFGRFSFDNVPPAGYSLKITAAGYEDYVVEQVHLTGDITRQVAAPLAKKEYYLEGVTVTGRYQPLSSDKVTVIERRQIAELHPGSVSDLLESVPGVFVQRSGGATGQAQVRIRGSDPKHVLVLVDGQKINPSGSGVADLNTIPVETVERIEIHKGGASAEFGPDALGGVINITTHQQVITHKPSAEWCVRRGDWGSESNTLSASNLVSFDGLSTRFAFNSRKSDGDFDFNYTVEPRNKVYEGTRINNFTDSYSYFGSGIYQLAAQSKLKVSGQVYKAKRGLPDRASKQNAYAFAEDRRKLISVRYEIGQAQKVRGEAQIGFSQFEQYFWDLASASPVSRFESRHTNDIFTLQVVGVAHPWISSETHLGVQVSRDILYHTDYLRPQLSMGKAVRDGYAAFVTGKQRIGLPAYVFFDDVSMDFALRYDEATTGKDSTSWQDPGKSHSVDQWSPKIGAALSKGEKVSLLVRASYGKSFRLPSVNSLFWRGDIRSRGNPNLRPERTEHSEGGMELTGSVASLSFSAGMTCFHSRVSDLVVWQAGYGGVWTPVNLESALITGHEEYITIGFMDKTLEIQYQNTITTAQNKVPGHNSYDKRLTFTPRYVTGVTARLRQRWRQTIVYASYAVRLVDIRYALSSNTRWYDAYRIDDLGFGLKVGFYEHWRLAFDVKVYNLNDESYVLMTHCPMPDSEWDIGLKLSYGVQQEW
ncbi:MAG: TonB-dependent receptor [bacterium]